MLSGPDLRLLKQDLATENRKTLNFILGEFN